MPGVADALVTRLGNLPGVDVLPTAAVLNVPVEATAAETASRLGVRFLVHGAIQISKGLRRLSMEMLTPICRVLASQGNAISM